jgi:hypothetical protein
MDEPRDYTEANQEATHHIARLSERPNVFLDNLYWIGILSDLCQAIADDTGSNMKPHAAVVAKCRAMRQH